MAEIKVKGQRSKVKGQKARLQQSLFEEAKRLMPGGVNSPVRCFKAVGGTPVFVKKAYGSRIYGEAGEELIDYCLSWGALILGHAHREVIKAIEACLRNGTSFGTATKLEIELAKLIKEAFPSIEKVRLTNSGTEAVMGAVRLARGYTGKNKIIRFEGSYHGHADYLLDTTAGVPADFLKYTLKLPYNNIETLREAKRLVKDDLAAVIVEPVAGNCGVILPEKRFLQELRKFADEEKAVLIFDEVITGFRVSYGGAQKLFGVRPDLTCLGKIIGGGMPVGAFGGRQDIMDNLAPEGNVYHAGTLSGNPVAVTAGITTLKLLKEIDPYENLERKTKKLCDGIAASAKNSGVKARVNRAGSMFSVFFGEKGQDHEAFRIFFHYLLKKGIYFSPSGGEADFVSTAHSDEDIDKTIDAVNKAFQMRT